MNTHGRLYLSQDEAGQWWYQPPGKHRNKAFAQTCTRCGGGFVSRRMQKFCGAECRAASSKGVLRVERVARKCLWCLKEFYPDPPSRKTRCCSNECGHKMGDLTRGRSGPTNGNWKGGKKNHAAGYVLQWVAGRGRILQHRLVMEQMLGRELLSSEEVHHKNGNRSDNRPENLELWVKRQPGGQRATDLVEYAKYILETYGSLESHLLTGAKSECVNQE